MSEGGLCCGDPDCELEIAGHFGQLDLEGRLSVVFQPILDLQSGQLVALEALSRFSDRPLEDPKELFICARSAGLGPKLEFAAMRLAMEETAVLPAGCSLSINLSPEAIASRELDGILKGVDLSEVIIELTEHGEVYSYPELRRRLDELRAGGARLAIDDTGVGCSNLFRLVELTPDWIKIDLCLTRGVDFDFPRRSLWSAVVAFASDIGAQVVAEGIETELELEALRELGVGYGQGFFFGHPAPLEELPCSLSPGLGSRGGGLADQTAC